MKQKTKHRIRNAALGVGAVAFVLLFVPSPLCAIPNLCPGGLMISWGYSETYINIPGYLGLIFAGTWIFGIIVGAGLVLTSLFRPEEYETRYCPTCLTQTEQFRSKTNYAKGFKLRMGTTTTAEYDANTLSHEYTCEKCKERNTVPKSPS